MPHQDVLAVQVSSVASESAFSTGCRIFYPHQSLLTLNMAEALVLRAELASLIIDEKYWTYEANDPRFRSLENLHKVTECIY